MKKIIIYMSIFIILIMLGAISADANNTLDNSYGTFLETFESIDAKFKFYNIKANVTINYDIDKDDIKSACLDVINDLGMEESNFNIEENWTKNEQQIYAKAYNENLSISIVGIKKSKDESYLIVDILDNKVYKNIVDIYAILKNSLSIYSDTVEIYTCIAGEYSKKLQIYKYDDILDKILYNMNAEVVDKVQEENFLSITAYSKILKENYLECLGNKINLNIGIRYSENDDKTLIYIATPIIKLDY